MEQVPLSVKLVQRFFAGSPREHYDLSEAVAYADSASDAVLEAVGFPLLSIRA